MPRGRELSPPRRNPRSDTPTCALMPPMSQPNFDMSLEEAMSTQRAIRRLKPDPVDDALVLKVVELALKAPSGSNQQNWEFVVVKDREVKARLGNLNRGAWNLYGGLGRRMYKTNAPMMR